ncbi:hypothetical protein KI387_026934, partial [Taxus chinensis]
FGFRVCCVRVRTDTDDSTHFTKISLFNKLNSGNFMLDVVVTIRGNHIRPYIVGEWCYPLLFFVSKKCRGAGRLPQKQVPPGIFILCCQAIAYLNFIFVCRGDTKFCDESDGCRRTYSLPPKEPSPVVKQLRWKEELHYIYAAYGFNPHY